MPTLSPNMGLPISTVGVDSGLSWEQNLNSSLALLDAHDHSPGKGVPINSNSINIGSDLPVNSNNLTLVRSVRFAPQTSPLSGASDLGCIYESGVDLWYNDGNGNQIQLTTGGAVNATSSGISSGTASASFISSVLTVLAATNKPANIQGASLLMGNNTTGTHYLTLSPPSAMAADYTLVLPAIPGVQSFLTLDTSGNIAAGVPLPLSGSNIASSTITQSNMSIRTVSSSASAGGVAVSSSSGVYVVPSGGFAPVTNLSVTITTLGNPVHVAVIPDGSVNISGFFGTNNSTWRYAFFRGATNLGAVELEYSVAGNPFFSPPPPAMVDFPSAGTYTYTFQTALVSGNPEVSYFKLVAYEIK